MQFSGLSVLFLRRASFFSILFLGSLQGREARSFDVFDTLVGRSHYEPGSVFEQVEATYPFPDFTKLRQQAERESLGDIVTTYERLQQIANLSDEMTKNLMDFEFQMELQHAFPIVENLAQVEEGDLLISDTYYGKEQIEILLNHVGLDKQVTIIASVGGKNSGRVFQELYAQGWRGLHIGDNFHADVVVPQSAGLNAAFYPDSRLSNIEKMVLSYGCNELAYFMRALRLQNPYPRGSVPFHIWNEQATFNVPILILSSLYIDKFCKDYNKNKILFATRECCHLIKIFQKLFPKRDSVSFNTSRTVYFAPSEEYISYVKSLYTENSVIVDGHGGGGSCSQFFRNHIPSMSPCLLFLVCANNGSSFAIMRRAGDKIERVNYDLVGPLVDYDSQGPVRKIPEYDLRYVFPAHACVDACLKMINLYTFSDFNEKVFQQLMAQLQDNCVTAKYIVHEEGLHKK